MFLKVKDKHKKGETGTISFQAAVSLLSQHPRFSYVNHTHISICIFAVNHIIYMRFFSILLNCLWSHMYVIQYFPKKSVKVFCLCSSDGSFVHLPASFLVWPFTFTEKSDCDIKFTSKINLMLSVNDIIKMLVKLLQTIWGYVTRCAVLVSMFPCLYLWCLKDMHFISYWYYVTYASF